MQQQQQQLETGTDWESPPHGREELYIFSSWNMALLEDDTTYRIINKSVLSLRTAIASLTTLQTHHKWKTL